MPKRLREWFFFLPVLFLSPDILFDVLARADLSHWLFLDEQPAYHLSVGICRYPAYLSYLLVAVL